METISAEEVQIAVRRFWTIFRDKTKDKFEAMYFPEATVFSSTAPRTEPGRLMVMRRMRRFFDLPISFNVDLGAIEVQIVGNRTAIATYVYMSQATETNHDGSRTRRTTPFARATQIFQRDEHGALRIIHEHFSSAVPPTVETLTQ
jgi:ketosteroid isomerase-like protein